MAAAVVARLLSVWSEDGAACDQLRAALRREAEVLAETVSELLVALEGEVDQHSAARCPPPTVAELQLTSHALQAAVRQQAALARLQQPVGAAAAAASAPVSFQLCHQAQAIGGDVKAANTCSQAASKGLVGSLDALPSVKVHKVKTQQQPQPPLQQPPAVRSRGFMQLGSSSSGGILTSANISSSSSSSVSRGRAALLPPVKPGSQVPAGDTTAPVFAAGAGAGGSSGQRRR